MADESILSGGISNSVAEAPILPVQGGGGLIDISDTDGGIGEIKVVEGGGEPISSVKIIKHYNLLDTAQYNEFVKKFTPTTKIDNAIKNIKIPDEKILHYGAKGDINVLNSKNTTSLIQIKIIPLTTKQLIILPPFTTPEEYINQFMFLLANNFMEIDLKKNFIIRKNIFVISLEPFKNEPLINFFYHKLKVTNTKSYYVVGNPFSAFVYPKDKGILVSKQGFKLPKPIKAQDLEPINFEVINEYNIKSMKYKGNSSATYTIDTITDGEDTEQPTSYEFTLKTHIAIISLIDEDIHTINVDLQGNKYRIRIPLINNKTDKIYHAWENNKYSKDEEKLIKDLHLNREDGIPAFLFTLAYFKCFDDVSLLTKAECSSMKTTLDKLYKRALDKATEEADSDSENKEGQRQGGDESGIISSSCRNIKSDNISKVLCTITYKKDNKIMTKDIELDDSYIDFIGTDKQTEMEEAARKKFLESN